MGVLGSLPASELIVVASDLNAHLGGYSGVTSLPCPCGPCTRVCLAGRTCSRGKRLLHALRDWGWAMCNVCPSFPTYTFSRGTCRSSLDYLLLNPPAIQLFASCHFTEPLLGDQGDGCRPILEGHSRLVLSMTATPAP